MNSIDYIRSVFSDGSVGLYSSEEELISFIQDSLTRDNSSNVSSAHDTVVKYHSFDARVNSIVEMFQNINW